MKTTHIGDRPLSLAIHLRNAVNLLLDEANVEYNWNQHEQCNCGLLARCIAGLEKEDLKNAVKEAKMPGWGWTTLVTCNLTGTPLEKIVATLLEAGLRTDDFYHLEFLRHRHLQKERDDYKVRANAARYLQRWAEEIEKFHAAKKIESEPSVLLTGRVESGILVS